MIPTRTLNPIASGNACANGTPAFNCTSIHAIATDIDATIDKSMPRPKTVIAMPKPRMPSTDTLCTIDTRLPAEKKLGTRTENTPKTTTAIVRMISSWPMRLRLLSPDIRADPSLNPSRLTRVHIR